MDPTLRSRPRVSRDSYYNEKLYLLFKQEIAFAAREEIKTDKKTIRAVPPVVVG
jgi:hypothetical protein